MEVEAQTQFISDTARAFRDFFEDECYNLIMQSAQKGKNYFVIDFTALAQYNLDLADYLLDRPDDALEIAKIALRHFDIAGIENFKIRVDNLPDTCMIPIWEIRTQLNKFIKLEGYVSELGDILIRPVRISTECPNCAQSVTTIRTDDYTPAKIPEKCLACGRKGKFIIVDQETITVWKIIMEEDLMELKERQVPKRKVVLLKDDLTSKEIERELHIGKKVVINGWLQTYIVNPKTGDMDTYFVANHIKFLERGWSVIITTEKEQEKFKEMAQEKDIIPRLKQSIMPSIHGEEEIKEALLLQLVGSDNVFDKDGFLEDRGNLHLALVGNPGSGKTYMIKYIGKFWPIYRFASAQTATGRGLIATATQEKALDNKWVLTPGVIPTCHGGLCAIDELDKMNKDDYGFLNNAMNDLKVHVDKAAHGILETDVAILTSMNPMGRVFTEGSPIYDQIVLPPDLLDRFDLIFPVFAKTEEEDQRKVFRIGLDKRREKKEFTPYYEKDTVVRYVAYARTIRPKISEDMGKIIEDRVIKFMRPGSNPTEEHKISNRIFGIVFRLICAYSRVHLREEVNIADLNNAMDLMVYSYQRQGLLTKDGLLDFARTERVDVTLANVWQAVKNKINELSKLKKEIPIGEIIDPLKNDYEEDKLDETVEKLKTQGYIYEPRRGFIQTL